jgi:long-chain acyl-CoA synthetase
VSDSHVGQPLLIELGGEGRTRSREELAHRGARLAGWLAARGCSRDSRVCYFLNNSIEVFEVLDACQRLGAAPVAINHHSTAAEARYVLEDSAACALIGGASFVDVLRDASSEIQALHCILDAASYEAAIEEGDARPEATELGPGVIIYTSGTTGLPKGVVRAPRSPEHAARYVAVFRDLCKLGVAPVHLVTGPLYHTAPSAFARYALALGGRLIIMARFDAEGVLRAIAEHQVTNLHLVPTMMHRLLALPDEMRAQHDLSSLVSVQHAAAPCPIETKQQMIAWWGPVIEEYYGSTEAGIVTYITSAEALERPGSVGKAIADVDLAILDEAGKPLSATEIGDVCVRSEVTDGFVYHGDPEKRERAARDGYYVTGDLGYVDDDGYLFLCDRRANLIIAGGVNIYPAEIEAALLMHPSVYDAAVYGVHDDEWGERVHAAVQLEPNHNVSVDQLREHLLQRIARFKVPRAFDFVDELPREMSGKLFKRRLQK